jgi:hypothetical protein
MRSVPLHKVPNAASAVGLLLAIVGALLAWRLGNISAVDSVLISLIGAVLALQFELLVRHEQRNEFARLVTGPRWLVDSVKAIAGDSERIRIDFADTPVEQEAERFVRQCAAELDSLRLGRLRRSADDATYLIQHTRKAVKSLHAVTNIGAGIGNPRWWEAEMGKAYWQANKEMAGKIDIRRVFLYSADQLDRVLVMARLQQEAGVQVRLLEAERARSAHRINFAIWDDSVAWEAQMNAEGAPVANIFSVGRSDIDRLKDIFGVLWLNSSGVEIHVSEEPPAEPGGDLHGTQSSGKLRSVDGPEFS